MATATTTSTRSPLAAIQALGQSTWLDYMSRTFLDDGTLAKLIREDNLQGITSNPTIFEKAISHGEAYDGQMRELVGHGADAFHVYDELTRADIARAATTYQDRRVTCQPGARLPTRRGTRGGAAR